MSGAGSLPSPFSTLPRRRAQIARTAFVNRLWTDALNPCLATGFVAIVADVEYHDLAPGAVTVLGRAPAAVLAVQKC